MDFHAFIAAKFYIQTMIFSNNCLSCGKTLKGRSDKKYCNYLCRNAYHNQRNCVETVYHRRVNQILRRNYDILNSILEMSKEKVEPSDLAQRGFNFQFFTSVSKMAGGRTCYFCYDLGYLPVENGYFALKSIHERHSEIHQSTSSL